MGGFIFLRGEENTLIHLQPDLIQLALTAAGLTRMHPPKSPDTEKYQPRAPTHVQVPEQLMLIKVT